MAQGAEPGKPGPKKNGAAFHSDRILVVDDEQVVRTSLEKILSFLGFTTESAPGPEAAITLLTSAAGEAMATPAAFST